MNTCILSGHLANNAVVKGSETKVLWFVLETRQNGDGQKKDRVSNVPCVMFNPSKEVEELLSTSGKGIPVELQGRVQSSSYEAKGERRLNTEVIVFNHTFSILQN